MIDTIRLHIPLQSPGLVHFFQSRTALWQKVLPDQGEVLKQFNARTAIFIPSYNREINYRIIENNLEVEFSIAKYKYGHNAFLLYGWQAELDRFRTELINEIREAGENVDDVSIPPIPAWCVRRIDFCLNYLIPEGIGVGYIIRWFQGLDMPWNRNKRTYGNTGIYFTGSSYTVKVYDKQEEVLVHDFKRLQEIGWVEVANEAVSASLHVLRVEVELKPKKLASDFKKKSVLVSDITQEYFDQTMRELIEKRLFTSFEVNQYQSLLDIGKTLEITYGVTRGLYRFNFYRHLVDFGKKETIGKYGKSSFYSHKRDLIQAGISLVSETVRVDERLSGLDFSLRSPLIWQKSDVRDYAAIAARSRPVARPLAGVGNTRKW